MNILMNLIIAILVVFVAIWLIGMLPLPAIIHTVLLVVVVLVALIYLFGFMNRSGPTVP